jgi:hypothetical protein
MGNSWDLDHKIEDEEMDAEGVINQLDGDDMMEFELEEGGINKLTQLNTIQTYPTN